MGPLLSCGEFSDCRRGNEATTTNLNRPEAAGADRGVDARPADSCEGGCPIDREQLLGSGVVAIGLGTDRGQDRSGQGVGGGSDGGFVIGGHDRAASSFSPSRGNSLSSISRRAQAVDDQYGRARS
jgi:hypothetical protein